MSRPHAVLSSLFLLTFVLCAGPAAAVDIIDLHGNNASGVADDIGTTVTISGVVTLPVDVISDDNLDVYVQDATGGVSVWVYGAAATYNLALGDSVTVTSRIAQYNGMTEVGTSTSYTTLVNHGSASGVPAPLALTCTELDNSFQGDYSEPNEGRLVRLDNLTITSGSWPTTSGTNTTLYVNDGTGTAKVYIYGGSPIAGTSVPEDGFSLVGIIKQYDSSSPYTDGYELVPRFASDVINPSGADLDPGTINDLTSTSARIIFHTGVPGSSEVEYGLTDSYGQTAGEAGAEVTSHGVDLTGLSANTIYHFRVKSTADTVTSYGPDQILITASDQPGEIHVLMSHSAETSYAGTLYDPVDDQQDLQYQLYDLIYTAESSVDAALYSFSSDEVYAALRAAHLRGCDVRLIIDQNNSTTYADNLAAQGVPYITSDYAGNHSSGYMHNKFVVIDAADADPYNDVVWTGSANMSYSGADDVNNAIWIKDFGLTQAYYMEFNEMWGSTTQTPGAGARLGDAKRDDTPHEFSVNGIRIEQYMSPSDGVTDKIIETIHSAHYGIYFCVLSFTHNDISDAMRIMRDGRKERDALSPPVVRGVFEQDQGDCASGSEYYALSGDPCAYNAWDPPADVWLDTALPTDSYLHHKYLLIDANRTGSTNAKVLTGSHNWSYNAESYNDENTLIVHDAAVANLYLQEFAARYHEAGGTGDLTVTAVDDSGDVPGRVISGLTSYPNPFNPMTRISFTTRDNEPVTVAIYDLRGRKIRTLAHEAVYGPGLHILGWDGRDDEGQAQASGGYIVRVAGGDQIVNHKMLLAR